MKRTTLLFSLLLGIANGFQAIHSPKRGRAPQTGLGVSYSDLTEKLPTAKVVNAVEKCQQAIASDVAAEAGVPLDTARKDLAALSAICQSRITVDENGELIYQLPRHLKLTLAKNSLKYRTRRLLTGVRTHAFGVVRMSFGVALAASMTIIVAATVALLIALAASGEDSGDSVNIDLDLNFVSWSDYGGMSSAPRRYRASAPTGFLPSCFSYLFGDGDPNANIESLQLALAANLIRENQGVVIAEQLAPLCSKLPGVVDDCDEVSRLHEISMFCIRFVHSNQLSELRTADRDGFGWDSPSDRRGAPRLRLSRHAEFHVTSAQSYRKVQSSDQTSGTESRVQPS